MSSLLSVRGIEKNYVKGSSTIQVLSDLSLELSAGRSIAIMGESGVGKSTLLQILGAIAFPDQGEMYYKEKNILSLDEPSLAVFRASEIGFVFQFHYLLPEFNALENVLIPSRIAGHNIKDSKDRAMMLLQKVGLEDRIDHRPTELSGGEQQRVAIARALMNQPSLLLADEPTGNLDFETSKKVSELFFSLIESEGISLIMATHSNDLALAADDVYRLREGRLHLSPVFSS
ncbi:MAG: ABC transporter ATP-binding protein [Bdellovibrionales bacterium]|nr:ABC transporter ATP-binding protein [Bdellovibrionales bacterium]